MKTTFKLILVVLTSLTLVASAFAAASTPDPLPLEAQAAINKGIIAAKLPDYPLAIRYFEEARKIVPQDPVVYLNLGLAESKISGRELRAMAWFGAYLTAYPHAPNAAAVKEQIAVLEVRNESNVSRLIKTVQDAAGQLPDNDPQLISVTILWAGAGDIAGAQKTTDLIRHSLMKSRALVIVAKAKIKAGDLAGAGSTLASALKSADRINTEPHIGIASPKAAKNSQLAYIAMAQAEGRDIAGAKKTFDLIDDVFLKNYHQPEFAKAQAQAGVISAPNSPRQSAQDTQTAIQPVISVFDWLKKLDDDNKGNDCPLNTGPFLDLAVYLKSLPPSDNPQKIFESLHKTAEKIISAQTIIAGMLKQQTAK